MPLLRRVIASVLSGVLAFGQPAEVLAASYVFRQASAAGTFPVPTITNNVVTAATYYKIDGRSYSISWQGTGGRSPYVIELVGSALPPGCSTPIQTGSILTSNCVFTAEGNFGGVVAQLSDANGMVVRDNAPNIVVTAPSPTLGTYSFPFSGYVATSYKGSLRVTGGRQPFNVSRATGQLPPGLSLGMVQDPVSGVWSVELSGTPTTIGSFTFDILVSDANQKQATSSKINVSVGFGPISLTLRPSTPTGVFRVMAGQPIGNAGVAIVGGTPPVSLSQQTGTLPLGLSIGADGLLVGTPTSAGTTPGLQIKAVDSAVPARTATSAAFTVQVVNGLTATVISSNAPYLVNQQISPITTVPNGGTAPYGYSLAGDLPPGIVFSKTTGQFTGTPTVAGSYPGLVVTVRDADGFSTSAAGFAMTVANPLILAGDAPRGVAGNPYTASFTASGGTAPYSFSLASGTLPFGLDLSKDGGISGTPLVSGTTDGIVVRVTDAAGSIKDRGPFSIVLADALAVATTPSRSATRGVAYSSAFTAAGGTAPYGFALVAGSLPPGLSLATGGTVSGTPTTVGSYSPLTVRLVDAEGHTATGETTIVVSDPVAIAGSAGRGTLDQPYTAAFTATGGKGPYAFSLAAGALPLGLSLASDGTISGSPTAAGTAAGIVVRVVDADGRSAQTQAFPIVVDAPLRIAGSPAAIATLAQTYSASFAASGGNGPYTFALATGTLPAGLTLVASTGAISGTPTTVGSSEGISVRAVDASGRTATSEPFKIEVGTVLAVAGTASNFATAGTSYSAQFSASGGKPPYAWTLASGSLPPGLSLDAETGLVAGMPTTLGSYAGLQLRVADASGRSALSSVFGISVSSSLAIAGTPSISATVGQPYSAQFTATGGAGAKIFSLATGQLPAGLTFDTATGLISGTPTAKGFSPSIAVRVRDDTNSAATAPVYDLYVSDPLVVSGVPDPDAIVGGTYSGNAAVAGGRPAYAWTLDAGTLPPGLQLSAVTGVISGTPTAPGTASGLRLRATDADGRTGVTASFAITVASPLTIAGQAGPGTVGTAYTARFAAAGGTLLYAYEIVGAALPAGLTLDAATGTIAGSPSVAAAGGTMQMRVTDAKGRIASTASFTINVRDAFRLVGSNLGPATVGLAYSGMMTPAGGRGPFVLSLAAGSLPPGLTLEPGTGVIAGNPTTPGNYAGIVIAGVDADGRTARSDTFGIEVADGISISGIPPQPATVGVPYDFAFTARGGQAPYTFALTGGNLPGGLTLDGSTGGMGGSPNRAGIASNLTVTAMDRARRTAASLPFTIDVRDPVSVTGTPPLVATTGQPYTASFAVAGGRGPFAFAMVGALPAGLTLNATSGTITGSATTIGDVAGLRVRATDQDGRVGTSAAFAIAVAAPLTLAGTPSSSADVGTAYSAKFTAAGGKQPYAFALKAGTLPAGLVLVAESGEIAGVPTAVGSFGGIQVQVADANGTITLSQSFAITVSDPLEAMTQVGPATVGQTYAGLVVAKGGRGPFTYTLTSGTLPTGLQIDANTGRISGTPRAAVVAGNLQVRVVDADARSVLTPAFSIGVSGPLSLAGLGLPSQIATLGQGYDSTVAATGGQGPYAYTLSEGALPAGLTLDATSGRISGTPTVIGAAEGLRISIVDAESRTVASGIFRIDVREPVLVSGDPVRFGTIGQSYAAAFAASGGRGPYGFALVGTLPSGLALNGETGSVSGIPTRVGTATALRIRATDQDGRTGLSNPFDIEVSPNLGIVGALPAAATVGVAYDGGYAGQDGTTPYTFALAGRALPDGLTFDTATGRVMGIPGATGTFAGIQVRVVDGVGRTANAAPATIVVSNALSASIAPAPAVSTVAYSAPVLVAGGRGPFAFTLAAGTLPAGLSLNAATGVVGGTPSTVQIASGLQVRVVDADARSALTQPFTISVSSTLTLALASNLPGTIGQAFTAQATAAGGRSSYGYAVTTGSLPTGLQLDAATGRISGTPVATGQTTFTITATDADGRTAQASSTIAIADPLQIAVRASDTPATVGQSFTQTFVGIGGRAAYSYSVTGTLPPGLTLNASTGVLAGNPTTVGIYGGLVVRVTDADGRTQSSSAFAIDVRPAVAFAGSGVPIGIATVGVAYASGVSATGGRAPYGYAIAAGALPAGLAIDASTGQIAGTPSQVETATGIRLVVTDADGRSLVGPAFQIDVRQPVVVIGSAAPTGTISQAYGPHTFSASGGRGTYAYAMVGTLPAGLSLTSAGVLAGTPSTGAVATGLQVRATDADGRTGLSSPFGIRVSPGLTASVSLPAAGTVGSAYSGTIGAAGGQAAYGYAVSAGSLPQGLGLDGGTGVVSGTPSSTGTFGAIRFRVTDSEGRSVETGAYSIAVSAPLTASYSPVPAVRSSAYSVAPAIGGGRGGFVYALAAGTLPAGLALNTGTGVIGGTPTTVQVASGLQVRVTDADGRVVVSQAFSISVSPALSLTMNAAYPATRGAVFTAQATASGGRGPFGYVVTSGTLPAGLTFDGATGTFGGTPAALGPNSLTVTVTDADGRTATASTVITVTDPLALSAQAANGAATIGRTYTQAFLAQGGRTAYVYAVAGTLPPGLSLNATTGMLGGTPTTAGVYGGLTVRVTDADGRTQSTAAFSIDVRSAMAMSGLGVPVGTGTVGVSYASGVTATGGRSPYGYVLTSGALPAGLSIDGTTGQISGTPSQAQTATNLVITASDGDGRSVSTSAFQIDVRGPVSVSGSAASVGTTGLAYGPHQFQAAGGRAPYVYAISGSLPSGLQLSSAGVISGTPTAAFSATSLQVRATDADGRVGFTGAFGIRINSQISAGANVPAGGTLYGAYSGSVVASGGQPGYVYTLVGGTLPPGIGLNQTSGALEGSPQATGTWSNLRFRATDVDGRTAEVGNYSISVATQVSASYAPPAAMQSQAYSTNVSVSGGRAGYTFAMAAGTLPAGLSLNGSTGLISGTPSAVQTASNLQVRVTDADGRVALTPAFSISVAAAFFMTAPTNVTTMVGTDVSVALTLTGGRAPFAWTFDVPALIGITAGGYLNEGRGGISGIPTVSGTHTTRWSVRDADGKFASGAVVFNVAPGLPVTHNMNRYYHTGDTVYARVTTTGGAGNYVYDLIQYQRTSDGAIVVSNLLGGTKMSTQGVITGSSFYQWQAEYEAWVRVKDAQGRTGIVQVLSGNLRNNKGFYENLPTGNVGTAYSGYISIYGLRGGMGSWSVDKPLPAGMSITWRSPYMFDVTGTPQGRSDGIYWLNVRDAYGSDYDYQFRILVQ